MMAETKKELFYDTIADEWKDLLHKKETQKRLKIVYEKLLSNVDLEKKKFLEVGCGLGYFSERAENMGAIVTGIDIGERLVKISKQRVPMGEFFAVSASKLPFKDESFDVILCTEVIEHVGDQEGVLNEMLRVLKKGGYLAITTPNRIFRLFFVFLSKIRIRPYQGNEKWLYTWQLRKLLTRTGWRLKKEYYFNFLYPNRILDEFEKYRIFRNMMINQGYLAEKR